MSSLPPDPDSEFVALLTTHQSAILFYVRSLLPGDSKASDVAQQTNLKIWEKRSDFEIGTNFKAWAFQIARYEVLNFRKKEARDARLQFSDELDGIMSEELSRETDDLEGRREALRTCLQKLKASDRELLFHRYFESTSLRDYAAKIGRSAGGVKVSLHRLRNILAQCIEKQSQESEVKA